MIVGALLGCANARSTVIYAHIAHDPAQAAANRTSEAIAAALAGKPHAEVIPIQRKATQ